MTSRLQKQLVDPVFTVYVQIQHTIYVLSRQNMIIVTIERTLLISGWDIIHLHLTFFQTLSARNQSLIGQYYYYSIFLLSYNNDHCINAFLFKSKHVQPM